MFTLFSTKNDTLEATEGLKIWKGGGASKLIHLNTQWWRGVGIFAPLPPWFQRPGTSKREMICTAFFQVQFTDDRESNITASSCLLLFSRTLKTSRGSNYTAFLASFKFYRICKGHLLAIPTF